MRRHNSGMQSGVFRQLLVLLPVFVASSPGTGYRNGHGKAGGGFGMRMEHGVSQLLGSERRKLLTAVLIEDEVQPNAFDSDFNAFAGVVPDGYHHCQDPRSIRGLFGKGLL